MRLKRLRGLYFTGLLGACWQLGVVGCVPLQKPATERRTWFQFVPPEPLTSAGNARISVATAPTRDVLVDAQPIEPLTKPVYPPVVRGAKLGAVTVAVRITIDVDGRVANITPSLTHLALPARYSREFQAAVEAALAQWRFTPSEIKHLEEAPGAEGGTYLRLVSREKIEARGEVVFSFAENGEVWPGLRAQ